MKRHILTSLSVLALTAIVIPSIASVNSSQTQPSNSVEVQPVAEITAQTLQVSSDEAALGRANTSVKSRIAKLMRGANSEQAEIQRKLEKWRDLFSPGERRFSFTGYEDLYVNTDDLLVFDSYAPAGHDREIRGWNNYRTLWEKYIPIDFPKWRITRLDITRIEVQGDTAWSTLSFVGRGVKDGKAYFGGQHGTHTWKRINGEWRIVHEHLTTMTEQEIQSRLSR